MEIIIYTDGASRGNPGHASYGFVIKDPTGKILHEEGKYLGINTNNFAEYSAILSAVEYVKVHFKNPETITVNFLMDSKLAVEQLSNRYKVKNPHIREFFIKIITICKCFAKVSYTHIPRGLNYEADKLANIALDTKLSLR